MAEPTKIHNAKVYVDGKVVGILTAVEVQHYDSYAMPTFDTTDVIKAFTATPTYHLTCWNDEESCEVLLSTDWVDLVKGSEGYITELHVKAAHGFTKTYKPFGGTSWIKPILDAKAKHKPKDVPVDKNSPSALANRLPGIDETVLHPMTKEQGVLRYVIINLNDSYKWTREEIADWLETLDIDITFRSEDEPTG